MAWKNARGNRVIHPIGEFSLHIGVIEWFLLLNKRRNNKLNCWANALTTPTPSQQGLTQSNESGVIDILSHYARLIPASYAVDSAGPNSAELFNRVEQNNESEECVVQLAATSGYQTSVNGRVRL